MENVTESSKVYIEQVLGTHAFHAYPGTVAFIPTKKSQQNFPKGQGGNLMTQLLRFEGIDRGIQN